MIERSSSAGSTAGPMRSTMHLTPTGSPSIGKPEQSVVVPGSRAMNSGNRPGMNSAGSIGSKKASCSLSTVSGGVRPSGASSGPIQAPFAITQASPAMSPASVATSTPSPSGRDAGDGDALADVGAGGAGLRGESGDAAAGAQHREVVLVEADRVVGRVAAAGSGGGSRRRRRRRTGTPASCIEVRISARYFASGGPKSSPPVGTISVSPRSSASSAQSRYDSRASAM